MLRGLLELRRRREEGGESEPGRPAPTPPTLRGTPRHQLPLGEVHGVQSDSEVDTKA